MSAEQLKSEVTRLLVSATSPELVNRMDDVIVFKPLTEEQVKQVIRLLLDGLEKRLKDQELSLDVTDEAVAYLARAGYDPAMGARPAKRIIQDQVEGPLSDMILGEELKPGGTAKVHVEADTLKVSAE